MSAQGASHGASGSAAPPARRPLASWELASALDDEPIGTVDDGTADVIAAPPVEGSGGNRRVQRMAEMHSWRDESDGRPLLRRLGLPDGEDF